MQSLYKIIFPEQMEHEELYLHKEGKVTLQDNQLFVGKHSKVDFLTYFNGFSLQKWKNFTNINQLIIQVNGIGDKIIEIYSIEKNKKHIISSTNNSESFVEFRFDIREVPGILLGISIASENSCIITGIEYKGTFDAYEEVSFCGVMCTFKREQYVKKNIEKISSFSKQYKWMNLLIIDNGRTLVENEDEQLKIIHNLNYGGSGGFTRGMIECVRERKVNYLVLMDDDIEIEPLLFCKLRSFIGGLKENYRNSFFAGAMLQMENPTIQYECGAYWNKLKTVSYGRNLNLANKESLLENEKERNDENQYAAWWFCAIPLQRIIELGYPLPLFIKGDDIEYSLRNGLPVLTLNGIGVWHEGFKKKEADWINYFSDRNMLMMHHFIKSDTRMMFFWSITLRIIRRLIFSQNWLILEKTLYDYKAGLDAVVAINAEKKLEMIRSIKDEGKKWGVFIRIIKHWVEIMRQYSCLKKQYRLFIEKNLKDERFWEAYYKL